MPYNTSNSPNGQVRQFSAAEVVARLGGRDGMARCPVHDDRKASLSLSEGRDGKVLAHCFAGCSQESVLAALKGLGISLGGPRSKRPIARRHITEPNDDAALERRHKAFGTAMKWSAIAEVAQPVLGSRAQVYLHSRGITCPAPRAWCCWRGDERLPSHWSAWPRFDPGRPALLVPIRSSVTGLIQGYHVTYLRSDGRGKAPRGTTRTMHGVAKGGVVEIGDPKGDVLCIAEGIETALSVFQVTECRTWASLSAANMASITLPAGVRQVIVCGDNDRTDLGQRAAKALAERAAGMGKVVRLAVPEVGGADWNDVLRSGMTRREMRRLIRRAPKVEAAIPEARPRIVIEAGKLPEIVDQAERSLIDARVPIFERARQLVTITHTNTREEMDGIRRPENALVIAPISTSYLGEMLMKTARFVRMDPQGQQHEIDCPTKVANTLMGRPAWRLPTLVGTVEAPTLRSDGTILDRPGYDRKSGLYFDPGRTEFPRIPRRPNQEDALAALAALKHPLRHFPFVNEFDKSIILASMLTVLIRRSLRSAPMFAISAPTMGSGKSLLADVIAIVGTGRVVAKASQSRSAEEDQKVMLALLLSGDSVVCFDNIERPLAGDTLSTILTEGVYKGRILGQNIMAEVPTASTFIATGNNLRFAGDVTTRALLCLINPAVEHPEERQFQGDLRDWVTRHRPELVTAGLTILRAYHVAGRPRQDVKVFGRFEGWSSLVRSSLVWLGESDPCVSRKRISILDPTRMALNVMLDTWHDEFKEPVTAAKVIERARAKGDQSRLSVAIAEAIEKGQSGFSAVKLGKWLHAMENRIEGGLFFVREGKRRRPVIHWQVRSTRG